MRLRPRILAQLTFQVFLGSLHLTKSGFLWKCTWRMHEFRECLSISLARSALLFHHRVAGLGLIQCLFS